MSDKTPPPDQPEHPESGEPVDLTKDERTEVHEPVADPAHETDHDTASDTAHDPTYEPAAAAPAPAKKRRGLLVPIIAAVLVLALVGGGLAAFLLTRSDSHKLVTPAKAAGMSRDTKTETTLKSALADAEKQFKAQDKGIGATSSAIYKQTDAKRGPEGGLVFLGGKIAKPSEKAADTFLATVRKQATANGFTVTNVDPGDGAKALCAAQAQGEQKIAICAWATPDTRGELLPTVSGWETPTLSKVMKDLRADVEVDD